MSIHTTHIDCGVLGEQKVSIEYDYQPEEKAVMHPIDDAYPGCAAEASITSVIIIGYNYQVVSMVDAADMAILELEILISLEQE